MWCKKISPVGSLD